MYVEEALGVVYVYVYVYICVCVCVCEVRMLCHMACVGSIESGIVISIGKNVDDDTVLNIWEY
jgi:hypothetical protein